ncbi:MAG: hypothetical protein IT288_11795, partial [Bdellovibrionales bacterium]|nr:hypothetical protein [Bdellovibrionales bacterium]
MDRGTSHKNPYSNPWAVSFNIIPNIGSYWVKLDKLAVKTATGTIISETTEFKQNLFSFTSDLSRIELTINIDDLTSAYGSEFVRSGSADRVTLMFELTGTTFDSKGNEIREFATTRELSVIPFYDGRLLDVPLYGGPISMYMQGSLHRLLQIMHQNFNTTVPPPLTLPESLEQFPCIENETTDCTANIGLSANDASLPFGDTYLGHQEHHDGYNLDIKFFGGYGLYDGTCRPDVPPPDELTYLYDGGELTEDSPYYDPSLTEEFARACQRVFSNSKKIDGIQKLLDVTDYLAWRTVCKKDIENSQACKDIKPVRQMTRFAKWVQINRMAFDWLTKNTAGFGFLMSSGENANWNFPDIDKVVTGATADQKLKYKLWHLNALVFGRWPDGAEIENPNGSGNLGSCAHLDSRVTSDQCDISAILFSKNTEHFGHFHVFRSEEN